MGEKPTYKELESRVKALEKDVSSAKRQMEIFRAGDKKYNDIIHNISDFIYFHDSNGNFSETNDKFKETFGTAAKINIKDILVERYKNESLKYFNKINNNGSAQGLMRVMTKNGIERILEYKSSLIKRSPKNITVLGLARDITKRYNAEQALRKSEKKYKSIRKTA